MTCRFSYKGLGEPLCFWAFGPLATTAFYLACSATSPTAAPAGAAVGGSLLAGVSDLVLLLSVVVGITTTVILFCSHWHQIQGDIAAGKMSPLVRWGTANACKVRGFCILTGSMPCSYGQWCAIMLLHSSCGQTTG